MFCSSIYRNQKDLQPFITGQSIANTKEFQQHVAFYMNNYNINA